MNILSIELRESLLASYSGWNITENGHEGKLVITSVNPVGQIAGTVFGDNFTGIFDNSTGRIAFISNTDQTYKIYYGYIADIIDSFLGDQRFEKHLITGFVEELPAMQPVNATNNVHGWYAITEYSCAPG